MTVIIRVGNALVADSASRSENHVFVQNKLYRLKDGSVFGQAGHNPSLEMVMAENADDLINAFTKASTEKSGNAMLIIRPGGICQQIWVDDIVYTEFIPSGTVLSVGCYRSEWESYQRVTFQGARQPLMASAVHFVELVNELNGIDEKATVLYASITSPPEEEA